MCESKIKQVFKCALSLVLIIGLANKAAAQSESGKETASWHGFRGPNGLGAAVRTNSPHRINSDRPGRLLWKVELPKRGMSSPVVWNDQVFFTGADEDVRQIYCVAAETGLIRWVHDVSGLEGEPPGGTLPRVLEETGWAASTATTNGSFVAAVFATGELVCVNMKGERVWAKHLGVPVNHYGHASSLINDGDRLFVQFDDSKAPRLLAFDLATGKAEWTAERDAIGWSSPILIDNGSRRELVVANSKSVAGYDPATGRRYWVVDCLAGEVAPSPAYSDGIVVVANEGVVAMGIDIRDHDAGPVVRWEWDGSLPDTSSPIAANGLVILPTGFGLVTCLDLQTGMKQWEHEFKEGFSSSPVLVEDHVLLTDLRGRMHVFKLSKNFESVTQFDFEEPIYASPAIVGNRVVTRSLDHAICIEFPAERSN